MTPTLLQDLDERYINYISNNEKITDEDLRNNFLDILNRKDSRERLAEWKNMKVKIPSYNQLVHLANPFYIGYGNPEADILFLGKEKAFNPLNSPDQFIQESVNNILHWDLISNNPENVDHQKIFERFGFNPMFPKMYFKNRTNGGHTWAKYAKIIDPSDVEHRLVNETEDFSKSFFSKCFLSEISHVPSRYSKGYIGFAQREDFLQNQFFKKFPIVIIAASGYLSKKKIKVLFDAEYTKDIHLGQNKRGPFTAHLFESSQQHIIVCRQLSGASCWTNEAMQKLANLLSQWTASLANET